MHETHDTRGPDDQVTENTCIETHIPYACKPNNARVRTKHANVVAHADKVIQLRQAKVEADVGMITHLPEHRSESPEQWASAYRLGPSQRALQDL